MVRIALLVWRVASTKWPVSAAESASEMVSRSRSSPITMTSGSSRSAARSARAKEPVCACTQRWFTRHRFEGWRYSMGSSMVRMCSRRSSLIRLTSAARFAAAGGARHEHHSLVVGGVPRQVGRQPQVLERRRLLGDVAEHTVESALLAVQVRAEATDSRHRMAEVELSVPLELRALVGCQCCHQHALDSSGLRDPFLEGREPSSHPHAQRRAGVQMHVAGAELDGSTQQTLEGGPVLWAGLRQADECGGGFGARSALVRRVRARPLGTR
jgi:hypothetical protein